MRGPYNLMFEDYFMQMLTAIAPQIRLVQFWRTLSNISAAILRINASMLSSNAPIEGGLFVKT